ncbi:MAG: hypothetical protein OXF20_01735, partial [Gammaproteobacteria bacterium]|nr:hypothetical protein [Gammaproteobacteria bacterium]
MICYELLSDCILKPRCTEFRSFRDFWTLAVNCWRSSWDSVSLETSVFIVIRLAWVSYSKPANRSFAGLSFDTLYLRFHGRILDSLGIQMYQSPVAAIAELIANAWDADANSVNINLPSSLSGNPEI